MYVAGFYTLLLLASAGAVRWGEWPERTVAAICWLGAGATILVLPTFVDRFRHVEVPLLIVDTMVLAAFVAIAVKADRSWTLWVAALQTISVLAHLGRALNKDPWVLGYQLMAQASSYPLVIALLIGVVGRARQVRAGASSLPC